MRWLEEHGILWDCLSAFVRMHRSRSHPLPCCALRCRACMLCAHVHTRACEHESAGMLLAGAVGESVTPNSDFIRATVSVAQVMYFWKGPSCDLFLVQAEKLVAAEYWTCAACPDHMRSHMPNHVPVGVLALRCTVARGCTQHTSSTIRRPLVFFRWLVPRPVPGPKAPRHLPTGTLVAY